MALPMTLVVGLLMLSGVQASDIADGSQNHWFFSEYMPLRSGYSESSIGDNGKFMAHHLNHMEHGGRPEASSDHNDLAEEAPTAPTVDSPFMIYSDKPAHPMTPIQDTMEFTPAQAGAFRTSKDLEPQKIADKDEDKDAQKLFTDASSKPIALSAIGVVLNVLFLCAAMVAIVRVRTRRGMQPAIALASSGGHAATRREWNSSDGDGRSVVHVGRTGKWSVAPSTGGGQWRPVRHGCSDHAGRPRGDSHGASGGPRKCREGVTAVEAASDRAGRHIDRHGPRNK